MYLLMFPHVRYIFNSTELLLFDRHPNPNCRWTKWLCMSQLFCGGEPSVICWCIVWAIFIQNIVFCLGRW